ncbi:MAG: metal ABC transporter permease [Gammaproteobacteria bacterium]|nr:metal ABC transporter permease [Gammaproteobacteria bacterium]
MLDILAPGLVAGMIVTAAHAPLGIEVLKRGIVFIDLATAQVVGLAIILLGLWLEDPVSIVRQGVIFGAGVMIALFFRWIERQSPDEQEAVIGSSFIVAASAGLLVLANDPHGGKALSDVLSGQILFISWGNILAFLPVYGIFAIAWLIDPRLRSGVGFFILFALVITASVQLVGVYVVFASLILPALAARKGKGYVLWRAYLSGAVAVIAAILISAAADLPAGPFLAVCFAISAAVMRLLYRNKTLLT